MWRLMLLCNVRNEQNRESAIRWNVGQHPTPTALISSASVCACQTAVHKTVEPTNAWGKWINLIFLNIVEAWHGLVWFALTQLGLACLECTQMRIAATEVTYVPIQAILNQLPTCDTLLHFIHCVPGCNRLFLSCILPLTRFIWMRLGLYFVLHAVK